MPRTIQRSADSEPYIFQKTSEMLKAPGVLGSGMLICGLLGSRAHKGLVLLLVLLLLLFLLFLLSLLLFSLSILRKAHTVFVKIMASGFGIENLPYGVVCPRPRGGGGDNDKAEGPRVAVRYRDSAVDLYAAARRGLFSGLEHAEHYEKVRSARILLDRDVANRCVCIYAWLCGRCRCLIARV